VEDEEEAAKPLVPEGEGGNRVAPRARPIYSSAASAMVTGEVSEAGTEHWGGGGE
jgi:hypothetical protein